MPYYVWRRNGKIVGYDYSPTPRPAPAIEITDDEAKELGIYVQPPTQGQEPDPVEPAQEPKPEPVELAQTDIDLMANAYREGVNEA